MKLSEILKKATVTAPDGNPVIYHVPRDPTTAIYVAWEDDGGECAFWAHDQEIHFNFDTPGAFAIEDVNEDGIELWAFQDFDWRQLPSGEQP